MSLVFALVLGLPAASAIGFRAKVDRVTAPELVSSAASSKYSPPVVADYSGLSMTRAFAALNQKMSREYAFTKWKGINWRTLYNKYQPQIAAAEAAGDLNAFYLSLRRYVHELRDGHVSIKPDVPPELQQSMAGGGVGLILTRLDNGDVVVSWLKHGGPAARAGIKLGARIVKWDGNPVNKALAQTSTVLGPVQPTTARKQYEQLRYLVRGPLGSKKVIFFQNPGKAATKAVTLTAVADDLETLIKTNSMSIIATSGLPKKMVEHRLLRGNVGYVRIYAELDLPAQAPGDHTPTLQLFRTAISEFIRAKVSGIVVDVRGNGGGSDQMVADFMSSFYTHRAFYEYQNYVVPATGKYEIWKVDDVTGEYSSPGQGIYVKPAARRFTGPVVALVDNGCISSCEGVAMGVKRLSNGRVVGFYGTNGSFGMVGDAALMPGAIQIGWPFGQSLDKNKVVQIDSRNGKGGVLPNATVPMTVRNAIKNANGHDVVLDYGLKVLRQMRRQGQAEVS